MMINRFKTGLLLASTTTLPLMGSIAVAQETREDEKAKDFVGLEEIVITARKRVENLQEVGLSVSAIGKVELERKFSTDIRDLVDISPNIVLDDTAQGPGGVASAYIRGIGVSEVEKNFDPAVGVVVDGIFLGQMSGSITRSIDFESLEVLRGPQGTVFGRNAIGGVINVERTKPTGEFGVKLRTSYGNYDTLLLDGIVNLGLGEHLALKLSATHHDQNEGFFENLTRGRDEGRIEYTSLGANLLFTPTDNLEIEYTYQNEDTDQDTPVLLNVAQPGQLFCDAFGFCSPDVRTPASGDRYQNVGDITAPAGPDGLAGTGGLDPLADATFDAETHIVEARWDVSDSVRVDYIFGSWKTEETVLTDFDATPAVLFHTSRPGDYKQTTNELRLTYADPDKPYSFVLGGYLWDSEYELRLRSFIGFAVPDTVLDLPQTSNQETDSWAVFFEGDYDFTDKLTFTLGGRFTRDEKETRQAGVVNAGASDNWKAFTPKAGLNYQATDDVLIYALYSAGFRSGGFNGRVDSVQTATTPYDEENVDNYEIGFKSELFDNTLRLNGTVFYTDYQDKQEEIQLPSATSGTGQVTSVTNASTATLKGIELDALYSPIDGLTIRGNLGLLDADYDEFSFVAAAGAPPTDFSNLNLRRAPEVTGSLSFQYQWTVGSGTAKIGSGWHYIGEYEVDFTNAPQLTSRAQHLVDASAGYQFDNIEINVFARNIFKEDEYTIGFDVAGLWTYASTRAPRTYGIEINYRY